jgi:guanine deaminase
MTTKLALRGDLLDFTDEPALDQTTLQGVRLRPDHWLLIEDGRIVGAQVETPDASWQRIDHRGRLVLPGFIDTHVHSPQLDVIASCSRVLVGAKRTVSA